MIQRFLIEVGGSQVDRISEQAVVDAVARLAYENERGMGSIHVDVEEIPAGSRVQVMDGYEPSGDTLLVDYLFERPR